MTDHLIALQNRLSREIARLASASTESEKALRAVFVEQAKKEIAGELKFLGLDASPLPEMSDDELLAELGA